MKKILIIIISAIVFINNIHADASVPPVQINLIQNFYSNVTKTYNNGITTIQYTNNLLSMNLTDSQLKSILSQKSGNGSSRLTYYETLNILVTPVEGTPYESLTGKSTFYRANNGGSWISNINSFSPDANDTAEIYNLNNNFWPWGFKLQYKINLDSAFTSSTPTGKDLTNKTLEEQIATVFDIDLESNPNGVIDLYPNQLNFKPLPDGYVFGIRFDFLDTDNNIIPIETDRKYDISSLKHLGTETAIIKYYRTEEQSADFIIENEKENSKKILSSLLVIILSVLTILSISIVIYYKKYKKIILK